MIERRELSYSDKLTRDISISSERSALLKKTYLLLSVSVLGMLIGGKIGINSPVILNLFTGWMGWVLAMVALNTVPVLALKWQHNPTLGTLALFADGFVAGIVIAPMLYLAQLMSGTQIVTSAAWITAAVFIAVTAFVYFTGTRWAPSRALYMGIFFAIMGAIVLNMFLHIGLLGILIAAGIGIIGIITLVSATSEILHNQNISSPIPGALMLFSGIFMVFQSVMHLLMAFGGGDD